MSHDIAESSSYDNTNVDEDEDYYLAPQSQRPFSAGIKRKRVAFVPASTNTSATPSHLQPTGPSTAAAKYLAIVLGQAQTPSHDGHSHNDTSESVNDDPSPTPATIHDNSTTTCPTCQQEIPRHTSLTTHSSSITHQLALEHSHPPSHIDRQRKGLKYLEGYGWDPDARVGLGARSEGIRVPVRAVEKRDTAGLGLFSDKKDEDDVDEGTKARRRREKEKMDRDKGEVKKMLNAKQVRKLEDEKKKRAEKLRSVFYGEDLSKYLGPDG